MRYKVSAVFTISFIFLLSCNRNLVNLDFTNAKDEVAPLTNLVFRFDKTLIADSLINHWDSTKYVSFEPAVAGKFRWEHGDELVFSPSAPLLPATSYHATLNSDILQYSKYDRFGNAKDIRFHTAELKLENSNSSWVLQDDNSKTYVPQLDLFFNYAVDPSQLKEKLKLTLDDKPVSFSLQTLSASDKISIRLANVPAADKDYEIKIQIDKGV
ncbi:MAG TPA: Ig-like domain-containing protein, partial [Puia sp.]|nr:Ig-like domain-containing protein [Puia sp.]